MTVNLRLQRLTYPYRGESIRQSEFGPSVGRFSASKSFFTCATMGHPNFANGQIQPVLDNLYANRKTVVGHEIDIQFQFTNAAQNTLSHTRPFFLLGQKDSLRTFEKKLMSASADYKQDSPLLISGLREFMIADFLLQSQQQDSNFTFETFSADEHRAIHNDTMGWLDLKSGCFALRSMNALNRVRELFGMRPHMAMMKQRNNYPLLDLSQLTHE
jgi:hypothetical protein